MATEKTFIFSRSALSEKQALAAKVDKKYVVGTVIVNGKSRPYTELLPVGRKSRFEDAQDVITGQLNKIKYTPESFL